MQGRAHTSPGGRQRPPRALALVAAAALGAALFGGVAAATHDPDTIHACVHKQTGQVRVVDDASDCKPQETPLEWNVEGPAGPQGPEGPPGPQGEPGGLGGHEVVQSDLILIGPGEKLGEIALCPRGKVVTGGGHTVPGQFDPNGIPPQGVPAVVVESYPVTVPSHGWVVVMRSDGPTASFTMRVRAVCVDG
ncbi:MAG TPA: hypothetical protein VF058_04040 [Actinomycetota bacterium]